MGGLGELFWSKRIVIDMMLCRASHRFAVVAIEKILLGGLLAVNVEMGAVEDDQSLDKSVGWQLVILQRFQCS